MDKMELLAEYEQGLAAVEDWDAAAVRLRMRYEERVAKIEAKRPMGLMQVYAEVAKEHGISIDRVRQISNEYRGALDDERSMSRPLEPAYPARDRGIWRAVRAGKRALKDHEARLTRAAEAHHKALEKLGARPLEMSYSTLAERHGLSRQRVGQIIKAARRELEKKRGAA